MVYDVLIIGAGVIGGMLARELSRYQLSLCLLEKENDVGTGQSRANSGIIHGGYDPVPGTLKAKLNTEGVELLFQAAEELHVPCKRNGSMVCAFSPEEEPMIRELYEQGQVNKTPNLEILTGDEARKLEPNLSPAVTLVLHVPNAGIIGPYVQGRYVVNCAGAYSDKIAAMIGDGFYTITPRAGEYMLLDKAEGDLVSHTLFQCPSADGKGILVSPTVHGNILVGPTATKVATPENKEITPAGLAQVERLSAKSVPSVNFRQVIRSFTGVRATGSTGDFILQESSVVPGLIHAGGVESPGLTCCVAVARYLIDLLRKAGLSAEEKDNWCGIRKDPHEFANMTDEEKDAYIRENPAYGKIVCRCETVSEGEILDAIRTNPGARDVDSVKRRTRSGMGRCQGGFCGPYVMDLLARELNIPMEQVTKSGGDSRMVLGRIGEEA